MGDRVWALLDGVDLSTVKGHRVAARQARSDFVTQIADLESLAWPVSQRRQLLLTLEQTRPWLRRPQGDGVVELPFDRGTGLQCLVALLLIPEEVERVVFLSWRYGRMHRGPGPDGSRVQLDAGELSIWGHQGPIERGAVVTSGSPGAFLQAFERALPELTAHVRSEWDGRDAVGLVERVFPFVPSVDLFADVLAACPRRGAAVQSLPWMSRRADASSVTVP